MPLKITGSNIAGGASDDPFRKDRAQYYHQRDISDMLLFFIPLGIVLLTSLILEVVAILYSRRLAALERAAELASVCKKEGGTETDISLNLSKGSAVDADPNDPFFKSFKS